MTKFERVSNVIEKTLPLEISVEQQMLEELRAIRAALEKQ